MRLRARVARIDNGIGALFQLYVPPANAPDEDEQDPAAVAEEKPAAAHKASKSSKRARHQEANADEEVVRPIVYIYIVFFVVRTFFFALSDMLVCLLCLPANKFIFQEKDEEDVQVKDEDEEEEAADGGAEPAEAAGEGEADEELDEPLLENDDAFLPAEQSPFADADDQPDQVPVCVCLCAGVFVCMFLCVLVCACVRRYSRCSLRERVVLFSV